MDKKRLGELIEEATIDCYGDYECVAGFYTCIEENLPFPFPAKGVGEEVQVVGLDQEDERILAVCKRKNKKYTVNMLDLKIDPWVKGKEWIDAYRAWHKGGY